MKYISNSVIRRAAPVTGISLVAIILAACGGGSSTSTNDAAPANGGDEIPNPDRPSLSDLMDDLDNELDEPAPNPDRPSLGDLMDDLDENSNDNYEGSVTYDYRGQETVNVYGDDFSMDNMVYNVLIDPDATLRIVGNVGENIKFTGVEEGSVHFGYLGSGDPDAPKLDKVAFDFGDAAELYISNETGDDWDVSAGFIKTNKMGHNPTLAGETVWTGDEVGSGAFVIATDRLKGSTNFGSSAVLITDEATLGDSGENSIVSAFSGRAQVRNAEEGSRISALQDRVSISENAKPGSTLRSPQVIVGGMIEQPVNLDEAGCVDASGGFSISRPLGLPECGIIPNGS